LVGVVSLEVPKQPSKLDLGLKHGEVALQSIELSDIRRGERVDSILFGLLRCGRDGVVGLGPHPPLLVRLQPAMGIRSHPALALMLQPGVVVLRHAMQSRCESER
jgi:hypothetical protein